MKEFYNPIRIEGGHGLPNPTSTLSSEHRSDSFDLYLRSWWILREETLTSDSKEPQKRQYPPLYERAVPIALGIVAFAIVTLLLIIFGLALGLFPGAG
jgi:hypothetical protein